MPALETLLDGMEHGDDVAVVLDQALAPLLSTLGSGPAEVRQLSLGCGCVWGTPASLFGADLVDGR